MKFSVIIPVYNVALDLRECLKSVMLAAGRIEREDIEIICVDDGSTDESGEILDEFSSRYAQIKVFHRENQGVSRARNFGIEHARGDWLIFVDADDEVVEETFEYLGYATSHSDVDIIHYSNTTVEQHGEHVAYEERPLQIYRMEQKEEIKSAFKAFQTLLVWNGCFRREALSGLRFIPIIAGEDSLFATVAFCRAKSVAKTSTCLYKYFQRSGSVMHSYSKEPILDTLKSIELRYNELRKWEHYKIVRHNVHKVMVNTLTGQLYARMDRLSARDRQSVLPEFFRVGSVVLSWSPFYAFLCRIKSDICVRVFLYNQYLLRVIIVRWRNSFLR